MERIRQALEQAEIDRQKSGDTKKATAPAASEASRWIASFAASPAVIFADPKNQEARNLLADTYTQLGYATENAPWRNFYLTGASELRNGINTSLMSSNKLSNSPDIITNMPLETFYNYLAVRLDADKAKGKRYTFNLIFPDIDTKMSVYLENQVLYNRVGLLAEDPDGPS